MAMTTITIKKETKERLADYKFGEETFDDVLNHLMELVPIEDISKEHIRRHYDRLKTFRGLSKDEFKKRMKKRLKQGG